MIKQILVLGGAFMAFAMGSGFASGQEILQFFSAYGLWGSLGAGIVALVIFIWVGSTVLTDGLRIGLETSQGIYRFYCGKIIGTLFEWMMPIIMLMFLAVMISGSGAAFEEAFELPATVGRLIMTSLCLITVLLGLPGLVRIIFPIGMAIITVAVIISLMSLHVSYANLGDADIILGQIPVPRANFAGNWWQSGILYGAFNLVTALPFLSGLGKQAGNKRVSLWAGIFGGASFIVAAILMNIVMLANITLVYNKQIPFLWVAKTIFPIVGNFFSVMLLAGIYTTAVPLLWSICNLVCSKDKGKKYRMTACVTVFIAYLCGRMPFAALVGSIYPATGILGVVLLFCMIHKKFIKNTPSYK